MGISENTSLKPSEYSAYRAAQYPMQIKIISGRNSEQSIKRDIRGGLMGVYVVKGLFVVCLEPGFS